MKEQYNLWFQYEVGIYIALFRVHLLRYPWQQRQNGNDHANVHFIQFGTKYGHNQNK